MRKRLVAFVVSLSLAAILVAASPESARAAPAISEPDKVVDSFGTSWITAFFEELGLKTSVSTSSQGSAAILVEMPGGGKFISALTVCDQIDPSSCLGLYLLAYFDPHGADLPVLNNRFNASHPFGKAYVSARGTPVLARYMIADGGITRANVFYNLTNFVANAKSYADLLRVPANDAIGYSGSDEKLTSLSRRSDPAGSHAVLPGRELPIIDKLAEDMPADILNRVDEMSNWQLGGAP